MALKQDAGPTWQDDSGPCGRISARARSKMGPMWVQKGPMLGQGFCKVNRRHHRRDVDNGPAYLMGAGMVLNGLSHLVHAEHQQQPQQVVVEQPVVVPAWN